MEAEQQQVVIVNQPPLININQKNITTGWENIARRIQQLMNDSNRSGKQKIRIAIDGYLGIEWEKIIQPLKKFGLEIDYIDASTALKSEQELTAMFEPYLGPDPVFGRLYKKELKTLFDSCKLKQLRKAIQRNEKPVICYGTGASLLLRRTQWNIVIYFDLTRAETLTRNKKWISKVGTQSISPKKLYYVDFQVNDKHRNRILPKADFYVDANRNEAPVMIDGQTFAIALESLANCPFSLKYMYEPGPWGGQWLKRIRNLPTDWVNCAWSYEVIAQEQSVLLQLSDEITIDVPWNTFLNLQYKSIMGNVPKRRFGGQFPIRYDYLDTLDGGDLSIQVHPPTKYIREQFGEPYHQGEMYYIVDAKENARVNLGLNEDTKRDEFLMAARHADEDEVAFDYREFVNSVPVKKHDLLLIPPGTVHGSGEGIVVLEISATTYRYTFKIYDHLRPDLNGVMRPIHVRHAFNVIKWFRRSNWVNKNLIQRPRKVRSGPDWAEYLIGDRREFFHIVFRLDFEHQIEDDTDGKFHLLTLVAGDQVEVFYKTDPERKLRFSYSETIIIPACFGAYCIENKGQTPCKIAKARLR